jgi:hypothetical protein
MMGIAPVDGLELRRGASVPAAGTIGTTLGAAPAPSRCPLLRAPARAGA